MVLALATGALTLASGCGVEPRPELPTAPPVSVAVTVPAGGVTLAQLGFSNGPVTAFSVPRNVTVTTSVDQPSGVTLVFSRPAPTELASYFRRALPATGFAITSDEPSGSALTFRGHGWHGSFTGTAGSSAVILRP